MTLGVGQMVLVNGPQFLKGIRDAQSLQVKWMRTELKRGAGRIRKTFIREQLHGPPGIKAGKLAKGNNVFTFVGGQDAKSLHAKIGISRILHVHEQGATLPLEGNGPLYIRENKGKANERIVAVVPRVTIPARLRFRALVRKQAPDMLEKVAKEGARASEVSLRKALQATVQTFA